MKVFNNLAILLILLFISSCNTDSTSFEINGNITDTNNDTIYLLKRDLKSYSVIDSTIIDKNGLFKFKLKAEKYPEFYILKLNNQMLDIATDSIQNITIKASLKDFASNNTIEGSKASLEIKKIIAAQQLASNKISLLDKQLYNKQITTDEYQQKVIEASTEYKNIAKDIILKDLKSPAAYFALFQKSNQYLFFDPYDKNDYKILAAVANVWDTYYPKSPRSEQMKNFTLEALKIRKEKDIIANQEITIDTINSANYFNLELPDINNKKIALSSLRGKYTILDFTVYADPNSPKHNMLLNNLYNQYKNDINIYQVSFDTDIHFWRNAASNIPWVSVYTDDAERNSIIIKFVIQTLPTTFLLDKEGAVIKRFTAEDDLKNEIQKII